MKFDFLMQTKIISVEATTFKTMENNIQTLPTFVRIWRNIHSMVQEKSTSAIIMIILTFGDLNKRKIVFSKNESQKKK